MIKKSFAVVAALLLMTSNLSANNVNNNDPECFELADTAATAIGIIYNLTHIQEYNLFIQLYDDCVENNE